MVLDKISKFFLDAPVDIASKLGIRPEQAASAYRR